MATPPIVHSSWPMLFDLASESGELHNTMETQPAMGWMVGVALEFAVDHDKHITQYSNIGTGKDVTGYAQSGSLTGGDA